MRDEISSRYRFLQKYEYFIKTAGVTADEIKASIAEMKAIEKRLVKEKSESLAKATMQELVTSVARKAGLNIRIVRPLASQKMNNYVNIPVYFEGNGDIKQIGDFLKYVESSDVLLKIDKTELNVTNVQNPHDLKFKIQVSGLMKR